MTNTETSSSPAPAALRVEELGRMIMAYSEVTERLEQSHARLEQTVRTLRDELSEKSRLLERKNRLAALGEMAAGMAHEIRNPLGGIQLYASMLAKDVAQLPASLELVRKISGGVKRLEGLVSSVLQFTREIRVNVSEADLAELVDNAVELASPHADAAGVAVRIDGPRPLNVRCDGYLIGQALLNLVLNAIEAMPEGGMLFIHYRNGGQTTRQFALTLRDSGAGIPPLILDRIFNPFFTTKDTGTGLGLAIVHRIIDAHDGTITASNPDGGGAQFEIRI